MKWFWYSLIGFCVLMCSCKTQKSARLINEVSKENVQTELFKYEALIDTFSVLKVLIAQSKLRITETIKITEYDKESGKPIKETHAEREIAQDSDKAVAETEERGMTDESDVLVKGETDFSKTIDSEEKLESIGGQESFGKWFGIVTACFIGLFLLYLWKKFRVS